VVVSTSQTFASQKTATGGALTVYAISDEVLRSELPGNVIGYTSAVTISSNILPNTGDFLLVMIPLLVPAMPLPSRRLLALVDSGSWNVWEMSGGPVATITNTTIVNITATTISFKVDRTMLKNRGAGLFATNRLVLLSTSVAVDAPVLNVGAVVGGTIGGVILLTAICILMRYRLKMIPCPACEISTGLVYLTVPAYTHVPPVQQTIMHQTFLNTATLPPVRPTIINVVPTYVSSCPMPPVRPTSEDPRHLVRHDVYYPV
jgi:hypothetical protein